MRLITLLLITASCLSFVNIAYANFSIQKKSITINQTIIQKIAKLKPDSSNAHEIEMMIGSPAACVPVNASAQLWVCQWKGDLNSSAIVNTLNVFFESGMLTSILGIDAKGTLLTGRPGRN